MKPEIWNKSQLESSGSKTCVEPIELELISIHNMQEAKTNRNGPELKLHGAASGGDTSPLFCSGARSGHQPRSPCTCLCGAATALSSNLKALLQGGQEHHQREHAALCKLGSCLATRPRAWKAPRCTPGPTAARRCGCVSHREGRWLHGALSAVLTPSSSPPGNQLGTRQLPARYPSHGTNVQHPLRCCSHGGALKRAI